MKMRTLILALHDYWHCGSGRGEGSHADALVERDAHGLPYVPGRTLKGLLREATELLEEAGAAPANAAVRYFGTAPASGLSRHESEAGLLAFSSAALPEGLVSWLSGPVGAVHKGALFRIHYSTAIAASGVAKDKSLRGIEAAVPMDLECVVAGPDDDGWVELLDAAFPLVRAIGGHRRRGFGRCTLAWKVES